MNVELDRIIDKVKKCIALSKSDNPHEAAAALRQAQALMRKHGIDEAGIAASEISAADVEHKSGNTVLFILVFETGPAADLHRQWALPSWPDE